MINTEILLLKCNSQINFAIEMNVIIIIVVDYHTASHALVSPGFFFSLNQSVWENFIRGVGLFITFTVFGSLALVLLQSYFCILCYYCQRL